MILQNFDFESGLEQARLRAIEMVNNGLYSRFGLSVDNRIEKALLGCLGEIAFQHYLTQQNIAFELDSTDFTENNSDEFDFKISDFKLDVKVAKKSTNNPPQDNWTYGYPEEQNPISKDYIVIGWIDFVNHQVGFYGWITGAEVSNFEVRTHNTFAGYRYLTPNHEFRWGALNKNFSELFNLLGS